MYKCILIPIDGTPDSRKAIKPAVQLAKEQNARVVALHVSPAQRRNVFEESTTRGYVSPREYAANAKKHSGKVLQDVERAASQAGVPYTGAHAISDFAYIEIIKAAKRYRCDLIFMASHSRRGLSRLLLGNETSRVLSHTTIPVLIHRA